MVMRLYLDGCSLTYGHGLPREQSLGHLFSEIGGYEVLDKSAPGKSNMSIAFDTYQNRKDFDVFVLGFTYSERFGIKRQGQDLKFFPGFRTDSFGLEPQNLDLAHLEVQKYFFTVFEEPYSSQLSDMLIDSTVNLLASNKCLVLPFTWQPRNTDAYLHNFYFGPFDRLPDGHLNAQGTRKLFDNLQSLLDV
jgi:hypothetical protein